MSVWYAPCGCSVAASMFGEREITTISMCIEHSRMCANTSSDLSEALKRAHALWSPEQVVQSRVLKEMP